MDANRPLVLVMLLIGLGIVNSAAFGQALKFSPDPVTFPDVIVGNTSPLLLTVTNLSSSVVTISSATVSSPADFGVAQLLNLTIKPGLSENFYVYFHPSAAGSRSSSVTFNLSSLPAQTLQMSGKGVAAAAVISLSPSSASFGTLNVGMSSGWTWFTLTNTGNVFAQVNSIVPSGDFSIAQSSCTQYLYPGVSCQIAVAFSPKAAGTRDGTLTISSTAANSPTVASLSGTGIVIVLSNNMGLGPCRVIPVSSVVGQTPTSIPNYLGPPVITTIDVPTLDVTSTSQVPAGIFVYDAGNGVRSTTVGNCFPAGAMVTVQFNARTTENSNFLSLKQFLVFDSAGIAGMSITSATIQNNVGNNQSSAQVVIAYPGTTGNPILTAGGSGFWLHDIHFDATTLPAGTPLTATVTVADTAGTVLWRSTSIVGFVPGAVSPTSGWWWNPATPGIGFFIERNDSDRIFAADFLYDVDGRAAWTLSSGALKSNTFAQLLNTYGKGQTLTGSYQANQQTDTVGALSLEFSSSSAGVMTWPGGSIPIQRFSFTGSATPALPATGMPESGWWWNPFESGRGFAIEIQGNSLFMCGFMYDTSGNPIWYLSSGQMVGTTDYTGVWTQYSNGQSLVGPYKPNQLTNGNVGAISIHFSDTRNAILTLPTGRQIVLTRFQF